MVAARRLRTCLLVVVGGLVLTALAVFVVLVNAVVAVTTLIIFATAIFLLAMLAHRGLKGQDEFKTKAGR